MGYVIKFFKFIAEGLSGAFSMVLSIPGMILTAFLTLSASLYEGFNFLTGQSDSINEACTSVSSAASQFSNSSFLHSDIFSLFSYSLALDEAWTYIVGAFAFFIAAITMLLLTVVPFLIIFGFSCTVVNTTRNMVNSFLPGAAKF